MQPVAPEMIISKLKKRKRARGILAKRKELKESKLLNMKPTPDEMEDFLQTREILISNECSSDFLARLIHTTASKDENPIVVQSRTEWMIDALLENALWIPYVDELIGRHNFPGCRRSDDCLPACGIVRDNHLQFMLIHPAWRDTSLQNKFIHVLKARFPGLESWIPPN